MTDISNVKRFWNDRPCNSRHSDASIDERPLVYSRAVTKRKYFVESHIPGFAEFDKWKGRHILELGCGIGTDAIEFARAGADVTALDISEESIKIARRRMEVEGVNGNMARFICDDIERPDLLFFHGYDLVYSFGAMHHTPDPEAALKNARRLLKPGGEFRMMVYNRLSWKAFWIIATYGRGRFWKWRELIPKHSEAQAGCPVTHTYSKSSLRTVLESNGFVVEDMWVDHIFPYRISDYIRLRYVKEWYWRILPGRIFQWLARHFGCHLMVRARSA